MTVVDAHHSAESYLFREAWWTSIFSTPSVSTHSSTTSAEYLDATTSSSSSTQFATMSTITASTARISLPPITEIMAYPISLPLPSAGPKRKRNRRKGPLIPCPNSPCLKRFADSTGWYSAVFPSSVSTNAEAGLRYHIERGQCQMEEGNRIQCDAVGCSKQYGSRTGILRHFQRKHKELGYPTHLIKLLPR